MIAVAHLQEQGCNHAALACHEAQGRKCEGWARPPQKGSVPKQSQPAQVIAGMSAHQRCGPLRLHVTQAHVQANMPLWNAAYIAVTATGRLLARPLRLNMPHSGKLCANQQLCMVGTCHGYCLCPLHTHAEGQMLCSMYCRHVSQCQLVSPEASRNRWVGFGQSHVELRSRQPDCLVRVFLARTCRGGACNCTVPQSVACGICCSA